MSEPTLKRALGTIVFKALIALFLLPGLTLGVARWIRHDADIDIKAQIAQSIAQSTKMSADERAAATAFYAASTPSASCYDDSPALAQLRAGVCEPYSPLWQFVTTERVAFATVAGNVLLLVVLAGLGALAFSNRAAQYASFVFGWRLLTVTGAAQIVLQGAFAVWLSFWITAHFFHVYIMKLILIVALVAAVAVWTALVAIFRRVPRGNEVQGRLLAPEEAPALWTRIRDFASRLGTAPPAQIVAGIDANFFVTEMPLKVGDRETRGRTLFVSLPLLRQLDSDEANAVFAHELGHFAGGDTANSAALGPKLSQYDYYNAQLRQGGVAIVASWLLDLYRVIFEIALQQSSRRREFAADGVAAELTSPQAVVRALVKVAAYAQYRHRVEHGLFSHNERHGEDIGIAQRVATGLAAFGQSPEFADAMRAADMPHPFDSHPPLAQRMHNVGYVLEERHFADVVCATAIAPWTNDIVGADAMEREQWQAFEREFAQAHEETLAYRYEPQTDEERALVLRYFPPERFALKKDETIVVTYAGLELPGHREPLDWDRVVNIEYEDATLGGDKLKLHHPERGWLGAKTTKVSLAFAGKDRERFKQTLGRYWHRHRVMRAQQQAQAVEAARV
ncbi:M48 family metallopeptidase [Tahibacter soli]|uniref:M48 family metallopeptidase n=1 Tax=Tahibacter soli TaxID=2983605 RepID=A0A9X3YM74_9GAMM|nr:M48 family metallopeptidase [Tahibacter soli]MDC8014976.1 M48 family metallopeptidase [Tahibacter soli]